MLRPVVIVFAKAPVPGRVKTRLVPALGAKLAARLHRAFVDDLLARLRGDFDVELHTDTQTDAWESHKVPGRVQTPGDLGRKLYGALSCALASGCPKALVLGADSPTLPLAHVARLLDLDADVALGPAEDGGYWGIACRRAHAAMFAGVEWSTDRALAQTLEACTAVGLSSALGDAWYDVDDPASLQRLLTGPHLAACPATCALRPELEATSAASDI